MDADRARRAAWLCPGSRHGAQPRAVSRRGRDPAGRPRQARGTGAAGIRRTLGAGARFPHISARAVAEASGRGWGDRSRGAPQPSAGFTGTALPRGAAVRARDRRGNHGQHSRNCAAVERDRRTAFGRRRSAGARSRARRRELGSSGARSSAIRPEAASRSHGRTAGGRAGLGGSLRADVGSARGAAARGAASGADHGRLARTGRSRRRIAGRGIGRHRPRHRRASRR